jgi:transposase
MTRFGKWAFGLHGLMRPSQYQYCLRRLRKNALFAGHDLGAEGWAMTASLIETAKLNLVDPLAWMTDVLTKLVNRWPASKIDDLMPWAYAAKRA